MSTFSSGLSRFATRFSEARYVKVIAEGFMGLMPITLVGSFALILVQLLRVIPDPAAPVVWTTDLLNAGVTVGSGLISIFLVVSLASVMARQFEREQGLAITVALASFLIVTPFAQLFASKEAEAPVAALELSYLGAQGMFVAIIVSILSTRMYFAIEERNWTIKMPAQVPAFVSKTFEQIVPLLLVSLTFMLMNALFRLTEWSNVHDFIYAWLQVPLQGLGSNVITACVLVFLSELLWFFGIHGSNVTNSLLYALFGAQGYENMEVVASGGDPTNILSVFFIEAFRGPRAMALAFVLILICRSVHMRSVGKVAGIPSLFTISEPMKFGIPMVLNPWLFVPMSLAPVVSILIAYFATVTGFLPIVAVNVPRIIPAPFLGLLAAGWQGAVVQILQFVVIVLLYLPFMRMVDRDALAKEQARQAAVVP